MADSGAVQRAFRQVDVFTTGLCLGNPVAVVLEASGLSGEQMQRFARWQNLSETTFVLPPDAESADYQVRIFTPVSELPFAGHPTLGTCHAWLEAGGVPKHDAVIVQQCAAGLVRVRSCGGSRLAFAAPPLVRSGPVEESLAASVAEMLGIARGDIVDLQWADNGPGWIAVLLRSAQDVLALRPGAVTADIGVAGPYPAGSPEAFEVRAFFPKDGATTEDPVTGSLNASLAQWLLSTGRVSAPYVASQGTVLHRAGRVHISVDSGGTIWVGGDCLTLVSGHAGI
jgi:PhzF family phenazine biosynthesis protein